MALAEISMQLMGKVDQLITNTFRAEHWVLGPESKAHKEVHIRGGEQIGVRDPNGNIIIGHSYDVHHSYDDEGKITERYQLIVPPKGYEVVALIELREELQKIEQENTTRTTSGAL